MINKNELPFVACFHSAVSSYKRALKECYKLAVSTEQFQRVIPKLPVSL